MEEMEATSYVLLVQDDLHAIFFFLFFIRLTLRQAIFALSFSCNRVLTVRAALQDIPKTYMPITQKNLPKVTVTIFSWS